MNPKNKPPFAPNLAHRAKQPQQRTHGFKPVVAQLKTVAPAQNVKLPTQSLKVLQTPRQVGPIPRPPVIMRKPATARPAAPPVYKPQPAPKVMQQKSVAGSTKPLHRGAVQLKAVTQQARPANTHMTRARVVQMAAEVKAPPPKKITAAGLKVDDYLFVEAASAGESKSPPMSTESKMKVLVLRKTDVDYKLTATVIEATLENPTANRNAGSDCPVHNNLQKRLPHYRAQTQPNLEYVVKGLGGSRIVVDVAGRTVYLSHHYGDASASGKIEIPKFAKKDNLSAFVELDPATWNLRAILVDARLWWDSAFPDNPPGH